MGALSLVEQFEHDLCDPIKAQRETLKEILTKLQPVSSLLKVGITPETSLEDFASKYPITDYEDYDAAIASIADGVLDPSSVIGDDELLNFAITSGTSRGRSKLIPWTKMELSARMRVFGLIGEIFERHNLPPINSGMSLNAIRRGTIIHTKSGVVCGGVSTLKLSNPKSRVMMQKTMASPVEICLLDDSDHGVVIYAHLLAGLLKRKDIEKIVANYANLVLELFMTLKQRFQDGILVNHLRYGVTTVVDGVVDENSLSILKPLVGDGCAELANFVESECLKGFDGILPRLFPQCKHIFTHTSGTMIPYAQKLKRFAGDDIPLISYLYGASEGTVAVNTDPLLTGKHADYNDGPLYTLHPRCSIVEFLPYPLDDGQQPILLDKVQVGGEYEIIVTSLNGMLRYRLGDVVRVHAFEKKVPVLEFLHRKSAVLSLSHEFMTEAHLMAAMSRAEREYAPAISLVDFVFDGDRDNVPLRYNVYCELEESLNEQEDIISKFVKTIDDGLEEENSHYRRVKKEGVLGDLKLILLKPGTFQSYRDLCTAKGTDPTQYKTPRCVGSKQEFRDLLLSSTAAEYMNVA